MLNDSTTAGRPALGASFTFMSDATLWLDRAPGQDRELRTAEVLRSRVSVCSRPSLSGLCDGVNSVLLVQDDGFALHFSNTTRKGIAKLVGPCPPSSIISGYVSRILGSRLLPLNVNRKFHGVWCLGGMTVPRPTI